MNTACEFCNKNCIKYKITDLEKSVNTNEVELNYSNLAHLFRKDVGKM